VPLARETGDYRRREPTLPLEPRLKSRLAANQDICPAKSMSRWKVSKQ
jgi:hypothetical protein